MVVSFKFRFEHRDRILVASSDLFLEEFLFRIDINLTTTGIFHSAINMIIQLEKHLGFYREVV